MIYLDREDHRESQGYAQKGALFHGLVHHGFKQQKLLRCIIIIWSELIRSYPLQILGFLIYSTPPEQGLTGKELVMNNKLIL